MTRVLCVDDESVPRQEMAEDLRREGYEVTAASSPEEALKLILAAPFDYDVVLTDLDFKLTSEQNGIWLAKKLLDHREARGYGPAPEVIGVTGKMIASDVLNRFLALGGRYVLKGRAESYLVEVAAAVERLSQFRKQGPTIVFVHTSSMKVDSLPRDMAIFACAVGESVNSAHLLHGRPIPIPIDPAPLLVFDYLARRTIRRSLRLEEVANGMAHEEFYSYWMGRTFEHTVSSESVKMNVNRIRKALALAFQSAHLAIDPETVLITESLGSESEDDESQQTRYRIKACVKVEHRS